MCYVQWRIWWMTNTPSNHQVTVTERDGKSGRGIVIQDVAAPPAICMDRIRDLANYPKMAPKGVMASHSFLLFWRHLWSPLYTIMKLDTLITYYGTLQHSFGCDSQICHRVGRSEVLKCKSMHEIFLERGTWLRDCNSNSYRAQFKIVQNSK